MSFESYTKITNNSINWKSKPKKNVKWIVTEKVHGSNFSFIYNIILDNISYGKRTGLITSEDKFFGYKTILDETLPKINIIINYIKNKFECDNIFIYGELFGGIYPNIESNTIPVQKGIYYSPNIEFYAFDIAISNKNEFRYIDYKISLEAFKLANILYAEPLKTYNSYEAAIEHPIGFNSIIPKKLGYPELKINKAEGIVIKSLEGHYMTKIKIPEFNESKYSKNDYKKSKETDLEKFLRLSNNHITINRLNNAISKVGELNNDNREEIINLFVDDILMELNAFYVPQLKEELIEKVNNYINEEI